MKIPINTTIDLDPSYAGRSMAAESSSEQAQFLVAFAAGFKSWERDAQAVRHG